MNNKNSIGDFVYCTPSPLCKDDNKAIDALKKWVEDTHNNPNLEKSLIPLDINTLVV
jgi:hypothetical protein